MKKAISLPTPLNQIDKSYIFYSLFMALFLFAPNMISAAYAKTNNYLASDSGMELTGDSVTYREVTSSDNGTTETIITYEESYIYQDTVTRYIPDSQFAAQSYFPPAQNEAIASYGSFKVVSPERAEMIGTTDSYSMDRFNQMIAAYPNIKRIDMIDVAGTIDDEVNLSLARKINALGITTHIPENGSVRSGGVELFLAGKKRSAHPSANFAVHSWQDENGMEPQDYAQDDPIHQSYIAYYRDVAGMDAKQARDFYWMTNSAPHDDFIDLTVHDIAQYASLN